MGPGFAAAVDVPAVKQAPLKKYQLLVLDAPVKSSLNVICCAQTVPAARLPSTRSRRVASGRVVITASGYWDSWNGPRSPRPRQPCCSFRHRQPPPLDKIPREYSDRPTLQGLKYKSSVRRN